MSDNDKKIHELTEVIWTAIERLKSKKTGRTVYRDFKFEEEIFDIVSKLHDNKEYLSVEDISEFVLNNLECNSKRDLKSLILNIINSAPKTFQTYFAMGKVYNFCEDYELGTGKLCSFYKLPSNVQGRFTSSDKGSHWYMVVAVKAKGHNKAIEKSIRDFKRNLSIYKLVYLTEGYTPSFTFKLSNDYVTMRDNMVVNIVYDFARGNMRRVTEFDEVISLLNSVVNSNNTDLEKKIVNAVDMYGLISDTTPLHIRFTLCVIALEGLLLDGDDKNSGIRSKIAEKVALLIGTSKWWISIFTNISINEVNDTTIEDNKVYARSYLAKRMRQAYDKRSAFAHFGIGKQVVTTEDYNFISQLLLSVVSQILQLRKRFGINKVQDGSYAKRDSGPQDSLVDRSSLDVYLERMNIMDRITYTFNKDTGSTLHVAREFHPT